MQCYTTHRDPHVFPKPDEFLPDRWLDANAITSSMKSMMMPFSQGSRACLGKSLAMMELKTITATLLRYYEFTVSTTMADDDMTMTDHFLVMPKGGKCDLVFRNVT
jgi:cytochrome P450